VCTYSSSSNIISVLVSNTLYRLTMRLLYVHASSTATSCRISGRRSAFRRRFRRNLAAYCLPVCLSRHLLTVAYLPLRYEKKTKNVSLQYKYIILHRYAHDMRLNNNRYILQNMGRSEKKVYFTTIYT
jgi:hypothetical protein